MVITALRFPQLFKSAPPSRPLTETHGGSGDRETHTDRLRVRDRQKQSERQTDTDRRAE